MYGLHTGNIIHLSKDASWGFHARQQYACGTWQLRLHKATFCGFSTFLLVSMTTHLTVCDAHVTSKSELMLVWHSPYISTLMLKKSVPIRSKHMHWCAASWRLRCHLLTRFEHKIMFHQEVVSPATLRPEWVKWRCCHKTVLCKSSQITVHLLCCQLMTDV